MHPIWNTSVIKYTLKKQCTNSVCSTGKNNAGNQYEKQYGKSVNQQSCVRVCKGFPSQCEKDCTYLSTRKDAKCLFNCRRRNLMVAGQATTGLMLHARGAKISVGSSPSFLSLLKSKLKTNLHNSVIDSSVNIQYLKST